MIRKVGSKWVLYSKTTGKRLGTHPSRAAALRQEQAIHAHGGEDSGNATTIKRSRRKTSPEQADLPGYTRPPEPSRPEPEPDESSFEYFTASFLSSVSQGDISSWEKYVGDPRVAQISSAIRKLGLSRIRRILGAGSFGVAAEDEAGHVLKLTSDRTEVQAGAVLKGRELSHVVWIAGSWLVRGVRIVPQWSEEKELQVGILSMEMVTPLRNHDQRAADQLSAIVHRVKRQEGAYPEELFAMKPGKARLHLRHVSEVMEGEIRDDHSLDQLGENVADGLAELRRHGVYAIDVHGGNIGWDENNLVYKLFDIGTSSSPPVPKPKVVAPFKPKRIAFEPYACESGLVVSEL